MNNLMNEALPDFSILTPDSVLNIVEETLNCRCTNMCRPMTSYINRVYEVELDNGEWVIAKFYRPGRWNKEALLDEQHFVQDLSEHDIPVVAPLPTPSGELLNAYHHIYFTLYPRKGGRVLDELNKDQLAELGRLIARMHIIGEKVETTQRITIHPEESTRQHLAYILQLDFPRESLKKEFETTVNTLIESISPLFETTDMIRIHGDCHRMNILKRPDEPYFLIDFDDMAKGPPMQDLWMLLSGHVIHSFHETDALLEGYRLFRDLPQQQLKLIEPLRAMRFIHYMAWCARQKLDGGFSRIAPEWGSESYWKQEIHDLNKQMQEIEDASRLIDAGY